MNILKALIILSIITIVKPEFGLKCFFYFEKSFSIYNIKNLYTEENAKKVLNYTYKTAEKEIKGKLFINICGNLNIPEACLSKVTDSSVLFVSDDSTICKNMLSSKRSQNSIKILNDDAPLEGFRIHQENSSIDVLIECDKEKKEKNPDFIINENNNLIITSTDACGILNEPARFVYDNKYICCGIFFVIGIIFLFLGGYKWNLILSFTGFLFGFGAIFFILWAFVQYKQTTQSYLIMTAIAIIVGVIFACLCRSFSILSYILLGFLVGFFITKYILLTIKFDGKDYEILLLEIGTGLVVGVLCAFIKKYMVAIMTSLLGGFLISYSIGFSTGLLDNFFDIIDKIRSGSDIGVANYVFFGVFIFISLIGIYFQFKFIKASNRQKKNDLKMEELIIE